MIWWDAIQTAPTPSSPACLVEDSRSACVPPRTTSPGQIHSAGPLPQEVDARPLQGSINCQSQRSSSSSTPSETPMLDYMIVTNGSRRPNHHAHHLPQH